MIVIGIVGSICLNNLPETNQAILNEGTRAIEFAITLASVMALWMGVMNIAKDSGLIDKIAKKMSPLMKVLFPNVPSNHKAMSYMVMNMVLNMLGAGNGATAFGLKAMNELQTLNKDKKKASPDMIMFLVINISSIQLIPFTMLKIRIDAGSVNPNSIIITTLFATTVSTVIGILSCKLLQRRYK
ncbi:MAG: nucleoside recognition domain-containing protein [Clostridiales bacterium]|nr:nucleoside recognition domain-containing protein [Clostridiales bacterium]